MTQTATHMSHAPVSILILEDGEIDREMYRRLLKKNADIDFQVTESTSYLEATKLLQDHRAFDCYVVDYQLPDADGMAFVREILSRGDGRVSPAIVMVTGQGSEEVAVEALKLGVSDYLTKKRISEGEFVQPLKNAIEKARLRTELRHYREALERSYKDMSDFAHTASHDLKAPLRRIAAYCDMLQEDAASRLNDDDKGILDRMSTNARRMQQLIDKLLAYSKITTQQEDRQEVDLNNLVRDVIEECAQEGAADKIVAGDLPKAHAYPEKIRQVIINLVGNAQKYRDPSRPLEVHIDGMDVTDHILMSVADNGIGIAPEYHQAIFQDFKRLHTQDDIEGTGLGLTICRKIVQMHGGDIWVESEPGKGSTFYFTLPHRRNGNSG
ncbi:MAG TPA: ATP-binding protein [Alphaproteobacteria bacterium]